MVFSSPLRHLNLLNLLYRVPLRNGARHDKPTSNSVYAFQFSISSHFWAHSRTSPITLSPSALLTPRRVFGLHSLMRLHIYISLQVRCFLSCF